MMKELALVLLLAAGWMGTASTLAYRTTTESTSTKTAVVEKTYNLSGFTGLDVSGDIKVHYTQGKNYEVRITTDERKLDKLVVEVRGSNLKVGYKPSANFRGQMEETHLYLTAPKMESIDSSGACSLTTDGFTAEHLVIDSSGATTLHLGTVHSQDVNVDNSGATKLYAAFTAKQIEMENSGATRGDVKVEADYFDLDNSGAVTMSFDFKGKHMDVETSGAGKINLKVDCQQLKAENSGVASMVITGNADEVKIDGSGVSRINIKGLNKY